MNESVAEYIKRYDYSDSDPRMEGFGDKQSRREFLMWWDNTDGLLLPIFTVRSIRGQGDADTHVGAVAWRAWQAARGRRQVARGV